LLTPAFHGLTSARQPPPPAPGRPSRTRTPTGGRIEGLASGGGSDGGAATGCRRPLPRRRVGARSPPRRGGVAAEERRVGARSPPRRGGVAAEERRAGKSGRVAASRRAAASRMEMRVGDGRANDVSAAELAGGARRRCMRVEEERRSAARRRRGACRGRVWRGEAAGRTGASRKNDAIWGKTVKCPGRRRGLYRTPTFCHGSC
jgi:hypothetical protein